MKKVITIVLFLTIYSIQAQQLNYYYNGNKKIAIYRSNNSFITYDNNLKEVRKGFEKIQTFSIKGFTILENKKKDISSKQVSLLKQISPAFLLTPKSAFKMFPTKTIRVKLKPNVTKNEVLRLIGKNDIVDITKKYDVYQINIMDINKSLEIANKIFEAGIAEFSMPDFYIPIQVDQIDDPLFPLQYQMNNTGQSIDGENGVYDIDINAFEAWNINLGYNITVAVIDEGLEYHEDIGNRLIGGFTPANNGNGTPIYNTDTHGLNCAGVIGASHNNIGIRGVAPHVNFLSVNIFANGTTTGDIADGIKWAVNHGADVLSNSWGYPYAPCDFSNYDIDSAIGYAVTNGRNGKGTVVVFSSGNNGDCVNYPARNTNVISVGAIDKKGNLFNYSARGNKLDLVAPSGQTGYQGDVRTLDRMGTAGRNYGNYENRFGGTSAACPLVSGVAALVLSTNPNLNYQQVRDILRNTAIDMGTSGFDNNFGYGRVNAYAALMDILNNAQIIGNNTSCNTTTYEISGISNAVQVNWIVSNNLQIVNQPSNTSITVTAVNNNISEAGFIEAHYNGITKRKNIWIGKAKPVTTKLGSCYEPIYKINATYPDRAIEFKINHNGNVQYHTGMSHYEISADDYNLQDGTSTTVYLNIRNTCGWSPTYPVIITKPTLCDCGYDNPGCGGSDGPPTQLNLDLTKIFIYPNPSSNTVKINIGDSETKLIQIVNNAGKIINEINVDKYFVKLDISNYANGLYFLKFFTKDGVKVKKMIIAH